MNERRCPECGNELQEQAVFCTTCGRDLASLRETGRHRTLLFGTPLSLLVVGIMLAWDIGWKSPFESGSDLGMILALLYVGGAAGQWLATVMSGREPDMISSWRGGMYAVALLPVTMLIGNSNALPTSIFSPSNTMASVIANEFAEATGITAASLIYIGLVLFLVTTIVNIIGNYVIKKVALEASKEVT